MITSDCGLFILGPGPEELDVDCRWEAIHQEIEEELAAIQAGFKNFDEYWESQFEGLDESLCWAYQD